MNLLKCAFLTLFCFSFASQVSAVDWQLSCEGNICTDEKGNRIENELAEKLALKSLTLEQKRRNENPNLSYEQQVREEIQRKHQLLVEEKKIEVLGRLEMLKANQTYIRASAINGGDTFNDYNRSKVINKTVSA